MTIELSSTNLPHSRGKMLAHILHSLTQIIHDYQFKSLIFNRMAGNEQDTGDLGIELGRQYTELFLKTFCEIGEVIKSNLKSNFCNIARFSFQ